MGWLLQYLTWDMQKKNRQMQELTAQVAAELPRFQDRHVFSAFQSYTAFANTVCKDLKAHLFHLFRKKP